MDFLDEELHVGFAATAVFFDGVADVEWLTGMDMVEVFCHIEGDAVDDASRCVIDKFEFDMLEFAAYEFASAVVAYVSGAENGLLVAWSERIEFAEQVEESWIYLVECNVGVNVDLRAHLLRQDVSGHKCFEAAAEFGNVLFAQ